MGEKTGIEWTDATWNPTVGCTIVSPGCTNCYAMKMAARLERMGVPHYAGLTQPSNGGPVWTGRIAEAPESVLTAPSGWRRPRRIFVNSMSDLFHLLVSDRMIAKVMGIIRAHPRHVFQVLTKRADRMRDFMMFECSLNRKPPPNLWLGVSVEDQPRADERIPVLLQTPAAVRFLSCEPSLGPVSLRRWCDIDAGDGGTAWQPGGIGWVIAGGESGPHARPMHPDWARSLRDQCAAAGVPFFFKQWGEFVPGDTDPEWDARIIFQDGSDFVVTSDGADIALGIATDHRGAPRHIWRDWWASGEGCLIKRAGKKSAGAMLDGREHKAFPT
jgi:protein gp37